MNAPAQIPALEAQASTAALLPSRMPRWVFTWARVADYGLEALAIGLMGAAAAALTLYAGRRELVGDLAEDYLRRRGVEAEVEVAQVDSSGFIGRVRLGSAGDPDFVAERVEVALAAPPPPEGAYAMRPLAIRVVRPRIKARWTGERLSFGSLDPLIKEALSRPPGKDPSPLVVVEQGSLRLDTPYGPLRASGSAVADDARLVRLDLAVAPAALRGPTVSARLGAGAIRVRVRGEAMRLSGRLEVDDLRSADGRLHDGLLTLTGDAPYPDMKTRRLDGAVRLTGALRAAGAGLGPARAGDGSVEVALAGAVQGPFRALAYRGDAGIAARTASLRTPGLLATAVRLDGGWSGARMTLAQGELRGAGSARLTLASARAESKGARVQGLRAELASASAAVQGGAAGWRVAGPMRVSASAQRAGFAQTTAEGLTLQASSSLALLTGARAPVSGQAGVRRLQVAGPTAGIVEDLSAGFRGSAGAGGADLTGGVQATAALAPAEARRLAAQMPVLGGEPAYARAITRALTEARVEAPGLQLLVDEGGARAALTAPVRLAAASGARAELRPIAGRPVFSASGGAFQLATRGGGLPRTETTVTSYRVGPDGFTADLRTRLALDLAIARGALLQARGRATSRDGAFAFTAAECVSFTADAIELGDKDLQSLSTRLCAAAGAPLVQAADDGYRVRGRFEQTRAEAPFLETSLIGARGRLDATGDKEGLTRVAARLESAEADDTATVRRYHSVALAGSAALQGGDWTTALDLLERPGGAALGVVRVDHDQAGGTGRAVITARDLRFAPDGLQPHDLTPLVAGVIGKVEGAVGFDGEIAWTATESEGYSRGRLTTQGLDFDSPAGRVIGLGGELTFSSLTPLVAPPGQTVAAKRIEAILPLENPRARFGLTPEALSVESAVFGLAGGTVTLEPITVPLEGDRTLSGAVRLEDVDIGRLIEASRFGDRVQLQAVVQGRVPFAIGPEGLRFSAGTLRSTRPGRLSIDREVLSGVQTSGGPPPAPGSESVTAPGTPPTNAFQDFAYQALENLAYDEMEVQVESRPEGRLGLIFTVRGRHDPPRAEQARIGLLDLLRGRAFERRIPLPKDTPVSLTLDTSLNFDELLKTYMELNRRNLERSEPVQRP